MDPLEAFEVIISYLKATEDARTPARLYLALLRATDEMVALSGSRAPMEQIKTLHPREVAFLRKRMSDLGV